MSQGARVLRPERRQLRWEMVDLDSQLPPAHRARVVWAFVAGLDLAPFYDRIKARDENAGRPASDPAVLLAVWLYATVEGIGAARAIARLCQHHAAYRWLCGGVPVNHDLLSEFRRSSGDVLDNLLTQSLVGLIDEGLLELDEAAIDGTKVRAAAGRGSMADRERLAQIEQRVAERVAKLKAELDHDAAAAERRRRERALRTAEEQAARVKRAQQRLDERAAEKAERAKTHAQQEAAKAAPRVSVSDPEVRLMRMADGATQPAWNVQVGTAAGFIVAIEPTDRRNDSGLAPELLAQIERRCGVAPMRLLADSTAVTQNDIVDFAERRPGLTVYTPLPSEREDVTAATLRKRRWQRERDPAALRDWRARMASAAGQEVYRRRKLTEHAHAKMKNRGFGRMLVHGIAKVRVVCFLHALAHNLLHACGRRRAMA
jgi:transposase